MVLFILTVNVPLSRMATPAWSMLTGFSVWLLDSQTKASIYSFVNKQALVFASPNKLWNRNAYVTQVLDRKEIDLDGVKGNVSGRAISE